jgi:hypothetical protein
MLPNFLKPDGRPRVNRSGMRILPRRIVADRAARPSLRNDRILRDRTINLLHEDSVYLRLMGMVWQTLIF